MFVPFLKRQLKKAKRSKNLPAVVEQKALVSANGWPYQTDEINDIAIGLVQRAYRYAWKADPAADTVKALLPFADFLIEKSGLFVETPEGQARLIAQKYSFDDGKWVRAATRLLKIVIKSLPKALGVDHMGIEVQGWMLARRPQKLIKEVAAFMANEGGPPTGVMQSWQDAVHLRVRDIKGVELYRLPSTEAFPDWPGMPTSEMMEMLFRSSPFRELLNIWVPITIPDQATRTHAHGMGPSGCGKTTFNEAIICSHLGRKGMVLFDTKGGMAKRLIRHSGRAQDIIEIKFDDAEQRPAFNLAQPPIGADRDQVAKMMNFILVGLGVAFTALQQGTFEMLTKIVVSIPNATLIDFIKVIENPSYAARHVADCGMDVQSWFATQYDTPTNQTARTQIARKLWNIQSSEAMNGLFNGNFNSLDFKELLDAKKLVIITISKRVFKDYTNIISRACIAAINSAMWRRDLPISGPDWILFFDELRDVIGSYDDSLIEELADQGREYHVCLHFTHQRLEQMSKDIQSAIINNASTNFYCNIDPTDAAYLAKRMGCLPGDMLTIEKEGDYLFFCLAVKGYCKAGRARIRWDHVKGRTPLSDKAMEQARMSHRAYWQKVNGRYVHLAAPGVIDGKAADVPRLKLVSSDGAQGVGDVLPWEGD